MGYDWEFDGSVDFAPLDYRKEKYAKCTELAEEVKDEETALNFLKAFDYIKYLAIDCGRINEIDNWTELSKKYQEALLCIESDKERFIHIIYPLQHQKWKKTFNYLRNKERKVLNNEADIDEYINEIKTFNETLKDINVECHKYNRMGHTLYWVKNGLLENKIRKKLNFTHLNKSDRIDFLTLYGVVNKYDYMVKE